ncbi:MAG TPA: DUF2505 domain-containing protein [Mycobacterium sp.]|nr:DUF2505 domain-containing protein [Mycobacterium sp.]HTX95196.1 DUF2505 domain-containing protein [Mycobacterium sp.]
MAEYQEDVEQVHRAFGQESFWLAWLVKGDVDDASLDSIRVGPDGAIEVSSTQSVRRDQLPGIVAQLHKGQVQIKRQESWAPITNGHATGAIVGTVPGAPISLSGTGVLAPNPDGQGAQLKSQITIEVRVPLVGRKVEKFLSSELTEMLASRTDFTNAWVRENS